jgi:hypothetical protein
MIRRKTRGGNLNLIRVLRHDMPREQPPIEGPWRVTAIVLMAIVAAVVAIRIFWQI